MPYKDGLQHPVILPSAYLWTLAGSEKLANLFAHPSLLQAFCRNFLDSWLHVDSNVVSCKFLWALRRKRDGARARVKESPMNQEHLPTKMDASQLA